MDAQSEKVLAQVIREARIASLGTLHDEAPQVSMVAYVYAEDFSAFYIFVSRLAQHTVDMQKDNRVSLMICETDDARSDPQTLVRVSIRGKAEMLQTGEPGYTPLKEQYIARFPESEKLFNLSDFSFWRISPRGGRYVAGFAKAFNITADTLQKAALR
ncbi:MAG TPA: pyridoxamine 5'-phosphate oxidase family protein [Anaerolineales bacterium]|nr:pyridoxamine 5'-phosphate oxidase family protein [Anaerolineales bacterium]HND49618.1 pyridoxamine 5'-phosphate oxidase family protein [Anaerolineales bacterium]HNM36677.1 pyridoxamine 5'-phosphate oxidase family protein [Anaerolineales bacterium]HNO93182.1 pyridoxamine 5'-phosphate oxidase family protein [Anaerolineales bacterium]